MAHLATTIKPGNTYGSTGKLFLFHHPLDGTQPTEITMPTGVQSVDSRICQATYNGDGIARTYLVGGHTDNMVFTENYAWLQQGIDPPTNELVAGAGANDQIGVGTTGTGITGDVIIYLSFWDDVHQRRSALSGGSPVVTCSDDGLNIQNLPTSVPNPSVTHWEVWHSVDGSLPALAVRRQIGATSIVEAIPTLSLGEVFLSSFERFPRCRYNVIYHDRQVMAGDDRHRDRLYFSDLTKPEQYGGLWLRTRLGEAITGLAVVRDILLVFCPRSTYMVVGYTEDDLEMKTVEPQIGCINHHGVQVAHGLAIVPSHLGFYVTAGTTFHFVSHYHQRTFRLEYEEHRDAYENDAWSVFDENENVYKFWVGPVTFINQTGYYAYWVLDVSTLINEEGGSYGPPDLSFDVRARLDSAAAILTTPFSSRGPLVTGSCDGYLRQDDLRDLDDDGDSYGKALKLRTKHYIWTPIGGGGLPDEGHRIEAFWLYYTDARYFGTSDLGLFVGDSEAWRHVDVDNDSSPDFLEAVPVSFEQKTVDTIDGTRAVTLDLLEVWTFRPGISGRGLTVTWTVPNPRSDYDRGQPQTAFMGFGGVRVPGSATRGWTDCVVPG